MPVPVTRDAPVAVPRSAPTNADRLPFTGGHVLLVALVGLGLLCVGVIGMTSASRSRGAAAAS